MIKSFLDKAKGDGRIGADIDTAGSSEIIFSTMLGSSVLHRADRSDDNLDHTISTLIDFIDSLSQKTHNKAH